MINIKIFDSDLIKINKNQTRTLIFITLDISQWNIFIKWIFIV